MKKKLLLIDAYALIFRAYFSFIRNPRYTAKGFNTSAILGFTNTLIDILGGDKFSHIAIVFDAPGKNFRHEMYKPYKANRPPTPEDIKNAIPYIHKIIEGFNIPIIMVDNYEADDVLGTLAHLADKKDFMVQIITPDKDFIQLITNNIKLLNPNKKNSGNRELLDIKAIKELYSLDQPKQFIDMLGLMGDSADNIPGCPGIGPKTAQKLIQQYKSIKGIYANINQLRGKQKESLIENKDLVFLSRKLATIIIDVPITFNIPSYQIKDIDSSKLLPVFKELEFVLLNKKLYTLTKETNVQQGNLFKKDSMVEPMVQNFSTSNFSFHLMDTDKLYADLCVDLCIQKKFSFHIFFYDDNFHKNRAKGIAFSFDNKRSFYVPFPAEFTLIKKNIQRFRFIFEDETIEKISYDQKLNIIFLFQFNVKLKGPLFDIALAHYIIHPELNHTLHYIAKTMLNYQLADNEAVKTNNQKFKPQEDDLTALQETCCERAIISYMLNEILLKKLIEDNLIDLYKKIELPLIDVLASMELNGVKIDKDTLCDYSKILHRKIDEIAKKIYRLAGESTFNIASPKQLGEVIFQKMKLISNAKKTKSGQYSTSEATLVKLKDKHPIIKEILQYRQLTKLLNTYIDTLPTYINKDTGKIHTCFVQTETATGRLSSKYPNLQNIPIRTDEGSLIRKAFIPSDNNHILLTADYSQIELRIMAHLSEDITMIDAFKQKEDIHSSTAAKIYKTTIEKITPQMRYQAKTANFGIIYGISAWGLAERLNISRKEGKSLIESYFNTYPKVKKFMDVCIEKARKNKFVQTFMGRKRYLPDINSRNSFVRGFAERNAINTPIQGSAADIIKLAMIQIHNTMIKEKMLSKMILQVHDELIFDCVKMEMKKLERIIIHAMENVVKLKIPLEVEVGNGTNWLEAH